LIKEAFKLDELDELLMNPSNLGPFALGSLTDSEVQFLQYFELCRSQSLRGQDGIEMAG
jgi:hypothetical protein